MQSCVHRCDLSTSCRTTGAIGEEASRAGASSSNKLSEEPAFDSMKF